MGKIEDAIKKINEEIQKQPENRYLALVGEHIIDQITTEDKAEKVLQEKRTMKGAMKEILGKARKQKYGNYAAVEDAVVYRWAREYFGLGEEANPQMAAEPIKKGIYVKLEDFL